MKYKAIIFDLDGTIVDTEKIWAKANQLLLERRNIEYSDQLRSILQPKIHGLATHASCQIIKDICQLTDALPDLIQEKRLIAQALYQADLAFIDGFVEFHDHIEKLEIPHAIATNADDTTVSLTDKALNLRKYFGEHIYGIAHVNYVYKPNPAIYLHAVNKLGFKPEECLAIEDSAHGIAAAQNAGMFCIGINTSRSYEQVGKAHIIVEGYSAIDLDKNF